MIKLNPSLTWQLLDAVSVCGETISSSRTLPDEAFHSCLGPASPLRVTAVLSANLRPLITRRWISELDTDQTGNITGG